jgi:hypothetical protein
VQAGAFATDPYFKNMYIRSTLSGLFSKNFGAPTLFLRELEALKKFKT